MAHLTRVGFTAALLLGALALSQPSFAQADAVANPNMSANSSPNHASIKINVTTYHYDNGRTGWNNQETTLTPSLVSGASFNLLRSIALDEQVDAQPLLVSGLSIAGGVHDVVYAATENNTVYAIDAATGSILLSTNLGTPVPISNLPGQCNNNSQSVGINSTPVIDLTSKTLYVIAYTYENSQDVFRLHALDLSTLSDKVSPRVITVSQVLADHQTTYTFDPHHARQRSALLLANGNVYAGFASFCDIEANQSRGWVLGWNAGNLAPLSYGELTNHLVTSTNNFFLSSIWMSGGGIATNSSGSLFFSTGNSDYSGTSYNSVTDLSESVVEMSSDLSVVQAYFTPGNVSYLDQGDWDVGSAGLLVLSSQSGRVKTIVVAESKNGPMFLLDGSNLGSYTSGQNNILGTYQAGECWCGPSYFTGSDGAGRIVSSGGDNIITWKLQAGGSPSLSQEHATPLSGNAQDPGSWTAISSNGTQTGTAIIWTVVRPSGTSPYYVTLYAIDPTTGNVLTSKQAGTWPNLGGNANIVPLVANGQVFVASYKQLTIYGNGAAGGTVATPAAQTATVPGARVFGTVTSVNTATGSFTLATRSGPVTVDATGALAAHESVPPVVGNNIEVRGGGIASGALHATGVLHAKRPETWPADQP